MTEKTMSILDHLEELRKVLLISIGSLIPASAVGWFFRERLLAILVEPVKALDQKLIYLAMTEAFMAELKIAIIAGFIIASPVIFWQVWGFILPALRTHEKRYLMLVVPLSIILFAGGVIFGYSTVFKYGIKFFLGFATEGLTPMLSLSRYLSFTFWFLLPFGLMFELPLLIFFMAKLGIVSYPFLARNRKFALLMVFVISAVATPTTDLISLSAMAIPMYILYEISIWIVRFVKPRAVYVEEPEQEDDNPQDAADTEDVADAQDSAERLEEIYRDITDRGKPEKQEE
ncbi:MAG: twin-arginine translocase subunit TatC [Bacillota bacterium]